ncbi:hypothetical protein EWM64_g5687 [Hericium alpestre]|uniref:CBF1-interacting co-repressor CIR N-terminal domain-containing protein n=1 Tax=Hericium alpestre TaxID=135208 RepID=A0A4Y9ZUQ5_9AGAM|nr:hypothetical protein EWM64_g5687 [Hericium alpestre]
MGKLNIAHHKSYHPYRQDNIARVKRDEEEARMKEAQEEDRALLADSEARIVALRQRAGVEDQTGESPEAAGPSASTSASASVLPLPSASSLTSGGNRHINLFEDIEQQSVALSVRTSKKAAPVAETEKGVPLAPTKKDLEPWYSSRQGYADKDEDRRKEDQRRMRDLARKSVADPIAAIPAHIAKPSNSSRDRRSSSSSKQPLVSGDPNLSARLSRESSERARAQALIARRKREMEGSVTATPSTVHEVEIGEEKGIGEDGRIEVGMRMLDAEEMIGDRPGGSCPGLSCLARLCNPSGEHDVR